MDKYVYATVIKYLLNEGKNCRILSYRSVESALETG